MEPNKFPETILLQRYLDGTLTEPESEVLVAWLKEHHIEDHPELEALLQQVYEQSFAEKPALSSAASGRILHRLLDATHTAQIPVRRMQHTWLRYAAAAVLIIVVASAVMVFMTRYKKETPLLAGKQSTPSEIVSGTNRAVLKLPNGQEILLDSTKGNIVHQGNFAVNNAGGKLDYEGKAAVAEYHTLSTPRGGQYKLQLPDGTVVWLNAASSITYPTAFTEHHRKVKITGEAYFEVTQQQEKPFIVDIDNKASVEVLGTSFNVNAYTDEQNIHTTLLDGSVKVVHRQEAAILKPGQQAAISEQQMSIVKNADVNRVMAWKNGLFQFDHAHLDEVLRQMSRWYDVDVVYEKGVPGILFSGEIKRDLNLSQALIILGKMGVHYKIEGKQLIVMP